MGNQVEALLSDLKGQKVVSVDHGSQDNSVTICLKDGREVFLTVEGDCCSYSYFTDIHQFDELVGSEIYDVEERDGESVPVDDGVQDDDGIRWHFLVFTTSNGHVTIDWRNDSNGYYDGYIVMTMTEHSTK